MIETVVTLPDGPSTTTADTTSTTTAAATTTLAPDLATAANFPVSVDALPMDVLGASLPALLDGEEPRSGASMEEVLPGANVGFPLIEGSWIESVSQQATVDTYNTEVIYVFVSKLDEAALSARFEGHDITFNIQVWDEGQTVNTLGIKLYKVAVSRFGDGPGSAELVNEMVNSPMMDPARLSFLRSIGDITEARYRAPEPFAGDLHTVVAGKADFADVKEVNEAVKSLVTPGSTSFGPFLDTPNANTMTLDYRDCSRYLQIPREDCFSVSDEQAVAVARLSFFFAPDGTSKGDGVSFSG